MADPPCHWGLSSHVTSSESPLVIIHLKKFSVFWPLFDYSFQNNKMSHLKIYFIFFLYFYLFIVWAPVSTGTVCVIRLLTFALALALWKGLVGECWRKLEERISSGSESTFVLFFCYWGSAWVLKWAAKYDPHKLCLYVSHILVLL